MEEGGLDAEFVNTVPDDLSCIVCHLALKDPVQIADCGHRFCSICFMKLKTYSSERSTDFTCPVDRKVIDQKLVFKDQAASRAVLSLQVKCNYLNNGCSWIGDLRSLKHHLEKICAYKREASSKEFLSTLDTQMKILMTRIEECEKYMQSQSLEINSLNENMKQKDLKLKLLHDNTGKQMNKKDKEIIDLKLRIKSLEEKDKNKENNSVNDDKNILKDGIKYNGEICNIEKRVTNIEKLNPKMGAFEWHLVDYQNVSQSCEHVESSIFYDYLYGHACQLSVRWFERRKGRIGVYFHLCKKENEHLAAPFRMKVIIQCIGEDLIKRSHVINEFCFSEEGISDDNVESLNESAESNGDDYFLCKPELDNFIVNDSMYFVCYLV